MEKSRNNKKGLLIAVGDSFTAGVGVYLPKFLNEQGKLKDTSAKAHTIAYNESLASFRTHSWPSALSKKLDYDVINLGQGGAANSAGAKFFIGEEHANYRNSYEKVIVIFLLSSPERASFYVKGGPHSFIPSWPGNHPDVNGELLKKWMLQTLTQRDMILETVHALNCVKYFSKSCGYKFAWGTAISSVDEILNHVSSENCLQKYKNSPKLIKEILTRDETAFCEHPNMLGYLKIADFFYEGLKLEGLI